jgi:DNA helicase II / ATP-dependent DNA helicase PcrA
MGDFEKVYSQLNTAQRKAVDTIEGPLLVIAGPGTGKTQLLSARVANILNRTDTLPANILCLTFTETGAANMRERLTRFIGQAAYDVQISTYHAFGGDLIQRYPEYFPGVKLQNPIDELGQYQILKGIVDKMSYHNPLKQTQYHLNDLIGTVSEVKRALLTPDELRAIAQENIAFVEKASQISAKILDGMKSTASYKLTYPKFAALLPQLQPLVPKKPINQRFGTIAMLAVAELAEAIVAAEESGKTTPLTKWKNAWLIKNADNQYVFDGNLQNQRIIALADVCEKYDRQLAKRNLYDFDDMILRSIAALEASDEFKFTLQERYQYILLDEYQDTNAAQAHLVTLLTDNPVNEGQPNIMAVGDDDQAIYAFQGAQYSNMLDFYRQYRGTEVINLTENYRSHGDILSTAGNIANQLEERLHHQFEGTTKQLAPAGSVKQANITRVEYLSDVAQYSAVAESVKGLVDQGVSPNEIAVLAPRHKYLEPLVGHLNEQTIPVRYEKRENILETSIIQQIISIARLVEAIANKNTRLSNALWSQVLSFEFWQLPTSVIWDLSWKANDGQADWSKIVLEHGQTRPIALLILNLALRTGTETCEAMLDYIIGSEPVKTSETDVPEVQSTLRSYYMSEEMQTEQPQLFHETLSHLTVLRSKLRDHQLAERSTLHLKDLLELIDLYLEAGQRMLDTSPYSQAAEAVQLMTVYKSKGLEFEHVFIINSHDDVWGGSSRGASNRITLPANLQPIRKSGTTEDERLRILFVAVTRAKQGLHIISYRQTFAGKQTRPLKYLDEQEQPDGSRKVMVLPERYQLVQSSDIERPDIESLIISWQYRHLKELSEGSLHSLLANRIDNYQLSPTHLNQFTDVIYGGPQKFFLNTILRFPQAPTINSIYGSCVHETLEWIQGYVGKQGKRPPFTEVGNYFAAVLQRANLTKEQVELETERGLYSLEAFITKRADIFKPGNVAEYNFRNEGVFVGDVHMGGKVDLLEIDEKAKTICVVDFKTGSWYAKWKDDARLHKYRQQLFAYKLLVEGSSRFKGYTVTSGRLEFIEPDGQGNIYSLDLAFDDGKEEMERVKQLLAAMWHKVKALDMPNTEGYSKDLKGIQAFEDDLIQGS